MICPLAGDEEAARETIDDSEIPTRMESCVSPVRPVWGSIDPRTCVWTPGVPGVACRTYSIEL